MRMQRIQRKVLLESDDDNDDDGDDGDDKIPESSEESDEQGESKPIRAYMRYMTKVISFMITSLEPTINLDKIMPSIKEASQIAVSMTKTIYKVPI